MVKMFTNVLRVATRVAGDILHEVLDDARRGMLMLQTLLSTVFAGHPGEGFKSRMLHSSL